MSHGYCPANCGRAVKEGHLLCAACWREVPREIQQEVYRTWRAFAKDESEVRWTAYCAARNAALASIA